MDSCDASSSSKLFHSNAPPHSARGGDAIALSSMRPSGDIRPNAVATSKSNTDPGGSECRRTRFQQFGSELSDGPSHSASSSRDSSKASLRERRRVSFERRRHPNFDVESGYSHLPEPPYEDQFSRWTWSKLFRSKLDYKIRSPESCRDIGYNVPNDAPVLKFCTWLLICFLYQVSLAFMTPIVGWQCNGEESMLSSTNSVIEYLLLWAAAMVAAGAAFLIGQGYFGLRATRERMERVRQTAVTLAYSFLKTTSLGEEESCGPPKLQLLIYECLALLTAYPVALLHQVKGNTFEPAVTRYCQEVARNLQQLRTGRTNADLWLFYNDRDIPTGMSGHSRYVPVERFFELFSLQLEKEFSQKVVKTGQPSLVPQYIIYNLRNHFENIVDMNLLDDRRTPIVRENIDMLALAGRECTVYAGGDVLPICMLWTVDLSCRSLALLMPLKHCGWYMGSEFHHQPFYFSWRSIALSLVCAITMMMLSEMWAFWDPFGKGMNVFSWSLGIASEIDNMLNEFYEQDTRVMVRKHAYMPPSRELNSFLAPEYDPGVRRTRMWIHAE